MRPWSGTPYTALWCLKHCNTVSAGNALAYSSNNETSHHGHAGNVRVRDRWSVWQYSLYMFRIWSVVPAVVWHACWIVWSCFDVKLAELCTLLPPELVIMPVLKIFLRLHIVLLMSRASSHPALHRKNPNIALIGSLDILWVRTRLNCFSVSRWWMQGTFVCVVNIRAWHVSLLKKFSVLLASLRSFMYTTKACSSQSSLGSSTSLNERQSSLLQWMYCWQLLTSIRVNHFCIASRKWIVGLAGANSMSKVCLAWYFEYLRAPITAADSNARLVSRSSFQHLIGRGAFTRGTWLDLLLSSAFCTPSLGTLMISFFCRCLLPETAISHF